MEMLERILLVLNDLVIIVFDLLFFCKLVSLRKDTIWLKGVVTAGCAVVIGAYYWAVYWEGMAPALAAPLCMTLPSMALFFWASAQRDARFFLTFCFVDTVSLILGFIGRYVGALLGAWGSVVALTLTVALNLAVYLIARPHFDGYHRLLEVVETGWVGMTVSSALIYFALIFLAVYPEPLGGRLEYGPVYLVISATVLSFYAVLLGSAQKTQRIYEQNQALQREQELYHMAYVDSLTGLGNRAAYVERSMEIANAEGWTDPIGCVMLDLNNLKHINDSQGHSVGDKALRALADAMHQAFPAGEKSLFRIGGDEFAIILLQVELDWLEERLTILDMALESMGGDIGVPLSVAVGYELLPGHEHETIGQAFVRADRKMYIRKRAMHTELHPI